MVYQENEVWLQAILNTLPLPTMLYQMGTGLGLYANSTAVQAAVPEEEDRFDIVKNAKLMSTFIGNEATQARMTTPSGEPIPPDQLPGKRVARGESFSGLEVTWTNLATDRYHNLIVYGCPLPASARFPAMGLVNFIDVTQVVDQREELKRAVVARDEFLSIASHELRTPTTSIVLTLQSLQAKCDSGEELDRKEVCRKVKVANRGMDRLINLINELMNVSRLTRPRDLKLTELDFCEVVRGVLDTHEEKMNSQRIHVIKHIPNEAIRGRWDEERVEQIVFIMVDNAVKYGLNRPIEVDVVHRVGHVELRVRDHGLGIKPQDRQRIFERFERAQPAKHYGGMGLGLWLASVAAKAMEGSVWVEDPPLGGTGAVFVLHLPL